ncbi:thiamine phosphate synthase [Gelidibacter japonicus]|uniref:thiamine phosphate synthase n=1 Tax=Gelidibacter japonicus TaxID=1962232 RepID=UPI0013D79063|nr:thiamine phosphate synthase [Gelidibacter japonicus]
MIVLIAPQKDIENETPILNQLFKAGLECYHLSKPHKNYQEHATFINEIDTTYHHRIVVHDFHELTNDFDLQGIHFEDEKRRRYIDVPTRYFKNFQLFGKTISSSFHELNELIDNDFEFDYHLLGPIFSSGHQPNSERSQIQVSDVDKLIYAVDGFDTSNLQKAFDLGFKGLTLRESVWNSTDPVRNFKDMKSIHDALINAL